MFARYVTAAVLAAPLTALAADVTIDMNGFPNRSGGHISGPGIEMRESFEGGAQKVVLKNVTAGGTYNVDFYHDSGPESSDFSFTVNEKGTGVASVGLGGEKHAMVKGFKPGDTTLVMNTQTIVFNVDGLQTGQFYIGGIIDPHTLPAGTGQLTLKAIPGTYSVDNLYNSNAGKEDYVFIVDSNGKTGPFNGSEEYAEFKDNTVKARVCTVKIQLECTGPVLYHPTHTIVSEPKIEGGNHEFDMLMTVGGGGLNVWSFGKVLISGGDMANPDGKPSKGNSRDNDFTFYPTLRYDLKKKKFYFVTTAGPADSVNAQASGNYDGDEKPLSVKATATITDKAPTTQPVKAKDAK